MRAIIEKEIMYARLDGETALLNRKNGRYYSLNKAGTRTWELLKEDVETDEIFRILMEEYDVEASTLRRDLDSLFGQLVNSGLVTFK